MVCTEAGEWRERLCAGGWGRVGSFLLFGSIPIRLPFLRVFISQGKNMSFFIVAESLLASQVIESQKVCTYMCTVQFFLSFLSLKSTKAGTTTE